MKKIILSSLMALGLLVAATTATYAVFSDSDVLSGSTVGTGIVDIYFSKEGEVGYTKPIVVDGLVPGEYSNWFRGVVHNQMDSEPVKLYFYVNNVVGDACDKVNLEMVSGYAGGNEMWLSLYSGPLMGLKGSSKRIELTGHSGLHDPVLPTHSGMVLHQRAQLDDTAGNSYQDKTCTWDEVFVGESYIAP